MKVQRQIDELLAQRASEWFETLKNPTEAERAAFVSWLGESRLHVQEFLEVAAVDEAVGGMRPEMREDLQALLDRVAPRTLDFPQRAKTQTSAQARRYGRPRRFAAWGLACAVLAACTVSLIFIQRAHEFSTEIGEQRTIELADASVVTLNADSRIQVHLKSEERDIELRQGEAIFKVAQDLKRPFRVRTRAGVVQALGTQFNVYARLDGKTRVSVLEGRVQLTATTNGNAKPQIQVLESGEEADIRLDGTIHRNVGAAVANTVAWRERRLVFSDTPLEEMILEFNRYSRSVQFTLQDVPAGAYRFAGIFDADDPESLAELLAREPDLFLERRTGQIVIRRR